MRFLTLTLLLSLLGVLWQHAHAQPAPAPDAPLRLGIVGLVHGHAGGFLHGPQSRSDIEIVGIVEADTALAARYAERFGLDESLFYTDLETMLDRVRPEAVAAFTNTYDHRQVVEASAQRGIHVMMEKPLAVSVAHGRAMAEAAEAGGIHVLVNYETTWYPSNQYVYDLVHDQDRLGALRKIVVRDGHRGPKEIGVGPEFLAWLTDPALNGAGALYDFGCYGANLITWLLGNQRPLSVTAITQRFKEDPVYAHVDDEATILLAYPEMQGIVQASWNWPYNRKDMDVYGTEGYVFALDQDDLRLRTGRDAERAATAPPLDAPHGDPLSYLKAVVRGEIEPDGLSSLENNLIVTEILEAARRSAETGETIRLAP